MRTYEELQSEIAKLQAEAAAALKVEKDQALNQIRDLMRRFDISASELGHVGKRTNALKGTTAPVQFRDPMGGGTWSGRGKMPNWMREQIANGRSKESFRVAR